MKRSLERGLGNRPIPDDIETVIARVHVFALAGDRHGEQQFTFGKAEDDAAENSVSVLAREVSLLGNAPPGDVGRRPARLDLGEELPAHGGGNAIGGNQQIARRTQPVGEDRGDSPSASSSTRSSIMPGR